MRVRIGFGLGTHTTTAADPARFRPLLTTLEEHGFDSLWLSERVAAPGPEPLAALAFAAGCTQKLKLGTSVLVVPGRNPVLLAEAMASVDRISGGRFLPAVGLGVADAAEHRAFGVARGDRAAIFDEVMPLLRRFWTEDGVNHDGPRFTLHDVTVEPKPVQDPLEVWLGGTAPSELRRTGRLGDGWLPSFCTPDDVRRGREVIEAAAADAGRTIDPGHFGALVLYGSGPLPERLAAAVERRRPGTDPTELVATGHDVLRDRLEAFVAAGATKFVVVPLAEPPDWDDEIAGLAEAVLPLQD